MAPPTNPNPADSSAKQSLEAGLAALKQQDYPTAIAFLESLTQTAANGPEGIRAQMGLVGAYKATGNLKKAIALCSSLAKSPNSQVKTWADRALTELTPPTAEYSCSFQLRLFAPFCSDCCESRAVGTVDG